MLSNAPWRAAQPRTPTAGIACLRDLARLGTGWPSARPHPDHPGPVGAMHSHGYLGSVTA